MDSGHAYFSDFRQLFHARIDAKTSKKSTYRKLTSLSKFLK